MSFFRVLQSVRYVRGKKVDTIPWQRTTFNFSNQQGVDREEGPYLVSPNKPFFESSVLPLHNNSPTFLKILKPSENYITTRLFSKTTENGNFSFWSLGASQFSKKAEGEATLSNIFNKE